MAVRPVRIYGDPVLRQKAAEIGSVDDSVRRLVEDMFETMKAYNGVGLAANQVGVAQRVLVVSVPLDDQAHAEYTMINPVVETRSGSDTARGGLPLDARHLRRRHRARSRSR